MPHPLVVNCRRTQHFDVYIGRPGPWGNPYVIGKDGTREEVIEKYRQWLFRSARITHIDELTGKRLGCWCAPLPCHGDILAELANGK